MLNDIQTAALIERLKADLAFHQDEAARITREHLDIDTSDDYSIEADVNESYHTGRVEAIDNVINILLGNEVELYSEAFKEIEPQVRPVVVEEAPEPQDDEELLERVYGVPRPHPCVNGHFDCATTEGGSCANELYAALLAKRDENREPHDNSHYNR